MSEARPTETSPRTSSSALCESFEFSTYHSSPLQLSAGDTLLVYSDGLTEAENPEGEMFGEERLLEIIRREAPASGDVLEKILLKSLAQFTRGRGQTDDITFVLLHKHV